MIHATALRNRLNSLTVLLTAASVGVGAGIAGAGGAGALEVVRTATPTPINDAVDVATAPMTQVVSATAARMSEERLSDAERLVQAEVRRGAFPGAALAAGRGPTLAMMRGIGNAEWGRIEVDPERTIYDIASLSKVVGTTTAVMLLHEDGRIDLDAPVATYLPAFSGGDRDRVTIRHLLSHTSGLPAGAAAPGTPAEALAAQVRTPLRHPPGTRMVYSDVGFVVLWAAAEQAAGEPLDGFLARRVFGPLQMTSTGFNPGGEACDRCTPSWKDSDGTPVRGIVHDPTARRLGGITGNAGLFSTVADLARFAAMMASGGELEGVRILREETIRAFTARVPGAGNRALGWETPQATGGSAGALFSRRAFGHTGFTGTSMWVDPERGTWTVLLANRTFDPQGPNRIQALRRSVNDRVAQAAELAEVAGFGD